MRDAVGAGFSMVELLIVLVVTGLVLGMGVPAIGRYMDDLALNGTASRIASTLQLTRSRAVATRTSRTIQFQAGYSGTDYRLEIGGVMQNGWTLPRRITYAWLSGTINSVTMTPDGLSSASGLIILQNVRGRLDTISVLSSGLVLTK